jgi:hypothetical protein
MRPFCGWKWRWNKRADIVLKHRGRMQEVALTLWAAAARARNLLRENRIFARDSAML